MTDLISARVFLIITRDRNSFNFSDILLEHPELPLHNNPAELGARTMVQRRNISYATQTPEGTKAWDIFVSLVATTRKLGISFFEYMRDRISQVGNLPSLGSLIREQSSLYSFDGSWIPE